MRWKLDTFILATENKCEKSALWRGLLRTSLLLR